MRKIVVLLLLFALAPLSLASIGFVQSGLGGSASGTLATHSSTLVSSAAGYGTPTTNGDLLVCVAWFTFTTPSSSSIGPSVVPTTAGFSWVEVSDIEWSSGNPGNYGFVSVYYILNAAPMSGTTTVSGTLGGTSGSATAASVEFSLYEFSGVASLANFTNASNNTGTPSIPTAGNVSAITGDLIFTAMSAYPGSNISNGTGYTLGVNAIVATIGQMQYNLSAPSGSVSTAFNGTEPYWVVLAPYFKATTIAPVPRHRGFVH